MTVLVRHYQKTPPDCKNSVVALGNFDGLHMGHRSVIEKVKKVSKEENLKSSLLTFYPHPLKILNPSKKIVQITRFRRKYELIRDIGVNILFCQKFSKKFSNLKAQEFCDEVIKKNLQAAHVVVGYDFIFGSKRGGNAVFLQEFCKKNNIGFSQVKAKFSKQGIIFSSSLVRQYLQEGKIENANKALGRNFYLSGRVREGKKLGRNIGFPTINLKHKDGVCPIKIGVYKVEVELKGNTYEGVANFGYRPTINDQEKQLLLEVHIFDFAENVYGEYVKVFFKKFLREEKKFTNINALKKQIKQDIKNALI